MWIKWDLYLIFLYIVAFKSLIYETIKDAKRRKYFPYYKILFLVSSFFSLCGIFAIAPTRIHAQMHSHTRLHALGTYPAAVVLVVDVVVVFLQALPLWHANLLAWKWRQSPELTVPPLPFRSQSLPLAGLTGLARAFGRVRSISHMHKLLVHLAGFWVLFVFSPKALGWVVSRPDRGILGEL